MPPNQQYVSRTQKPTSQTQPPQTSQHQSMNALPAGLFKQAVPMQHEQVIQLQQQLGNQATMRLLQRQHQSPDVTKKTIQQK